MSTRIDDKPTFVKLWMAGVLGNRLHAWSSLQAFEDDAFARFENKTYSIRCKRPDSRKMQSRLTYTQVGKIIRTYVFMEGYKQDDFTINESAPDDQLILQGEVRQSERHYELHYSREKLPMRQALARDTVQNAHGITALHILKCTLDPSSMDDIQTLLDTYPDSVVEFSTYSRNLGKMPGRNTIIWEVRNY